MTTILPATLGARPTTTVTMSVGATVADLRALLRSLPASARLADVVLGDVEHVAAMHDLIDVALTFTPEELPR